MKSESKIRELLELVLRMQKAAARVGIPVPANVLAMKQTLEWVMDKQSPEDKSNSEDVINMMTTACEATDKLDKLGRES